MGQTNQEEKGCRERYVVCYYLRVLFGFRKMILVMNYITSIFIWGKGVKMMGVLKVDFCFHFKSSEVVLLFCYDHVIFRPTTPRIPKIAENESKSLKTSENY